MRAVLLYNGKQKQPGGQQPCRKSRQAFPSCCTSSRRPKRRKTPTFMNCRTQCRSCWTKCGIWTRWWTCCARSSLAAPARKRLSRRKSLWGCSRRRRRNTSRTPRSPTRKTNGVFTGKTRRTSGSWKSLRTPRIEFMTWTRRNRFARNAAAG